MVAAVEPAEADARRQHTGVGSLMPVPHTRPDDEVGRQVGLGANRRAIYLIEIPPRSLTGAAEKTRFPLAPARSCRLISVR